MISTEDKKWLNKVLGECFSDRHDEYSGQKKLEAFGMLVRGMVKNIERDLCEMQTLWERGAATEELRKRFGLVKRCLFYLEQFCRKKIEGGRDG